jgi:magnesium chelatase subunit I
MLPDLEQGQSSLLLRLLNLSGARAVLATDAPDLGIAEVKPYPFLALVGQYEMRVALLLAIINPAIGGVLLIGPRGTGKTTAVRSLLDILPDTEVSDCDEGALPADMHNEASRLLYPDCYERMEKGEAISHYERVKLVELPLNARLDDVVGGINERVAAHGRIKLERGILARADNNLLYIDEVNLLDDQIVDAILDAAAQGSYTVRRGAMVGTYRARFTLIGSMNPEEGRLRPQILDRFGLRVNVRGLTSSADRLEVYQRVRQYRQNPFAFVRSYAGATAEVAQDILLARELLPHVTLDDEALMIGMALIEQLKIDSHRAEYTMFEAARAHAAADGRQIATGGDIRVVAPLALRQRQSEFMNHFFEQQWIEDQRIHETLNQLTDSQQ